MDSFDFHGIEIPYREGTRAISCSGGADSSLMLYILMNQFRDDTLHVYTLAKTANFRTTAVASANVIERCIQLTGNNNVTHHVQYLDEVSGPMDMIQWIRTFKKTLGHDIFYSGVTANPPKDIADGFLQPAHEWNADHDDRDPLKDHDVVLGNPEIGEIVRPFVNINKQEIARLYKEEELMDTLYGETLSCERPPHENNYEHCDGCWWCKERLWGFGRYT